MTLQERKERWERELSRLLSCGERWGECRRFAGRSAGIRLDRSRWLISHIAEAETRLTANAGGQHAPTCSVPYLWRDDGERFSRNEDGTYAQQGDK